MDEKLLEVILIAERIKADKFRLEEICRQMGRRAPADELPKPAGRGRGGRRVVKKDKTPASSDAERIRKEQRRKVKCSICGTVTGAIRKGPGLGTYFPSRHKTIDGTEKCPGMEKPASLVVEQG
jgi:ribosomal protein L34E